MDNQIEKIRCLIIGSGPAGYTAAIYASRADLKPILYQGNQPGGQLTITTEVDNFPGYPNGVNGPEMMEDLKKQAERFGTDVRWGTIEAVDFSHHPFQCKADDGKTIEAETVIVATGASAKWLGIPSEQEYMGAGVSGCATCDGYFYRGKIVYLIHRRTEMRASKAMQNKVMNTANIGIIWDSVVDEIIGEKEGFMKSVNGIILKNVKTNEKKKLDLDGVFIAIGHKPNSEIFIDQLELDEAGYIKTVPGTTRTNIEGVFAAGDVQDHYYRQAITAAGTGAMAAIEAERFLSSN